MFCAISGNAPKVAVVAKGSGHVFEKSLLEKYLVAEGKVRLRAGYPHTPLAPAPATRGNHRLT